MSQTAIEVNRPFDGQAHLSRKSAAKELLRQLAADYPACFGRKATRPLRRDIHLDIMAAYPGTDPLAIRRVMCCHVIRPSYQRAISLGLMRVNLDGSDAGLPTDVERKYAASKLQNLKEQRDSRKAPATNIAATVTRRATR